MNKVYFIVAAFFVFFFCLSAQAEERAPGLYAIVGEECIPLTFAYGSVYVSRESISGTLTEFETVRFPGVSTAVQSSGKFLLVIDRKQSKSVRNLDDYDPFYKGMNPNAMMLIPLKVNEEKQWREYRTGSYVNGMRMDGRSKRDFDWERINDHSFSISAPALRSGEYAFVFRPFPMYEIDCYVCFGFSVPEKQP